MSDISVDDDLLFSQHTQEIEAGVEHARRQLNKLKKTGRCQFCDDPLPTPDATYCDEYCREDHAKELHNKMVRGER